MANDMDGAGASILSQKFDELIRALTLIPVPVNGERRSPYGECARAAAR